VGYLGFDWLSHGNHFQRVPQPDQAGQPLGAAGSRDQPYLHLRLTQIGTSGSHTIVTSHGDFQATAKTIAVDGCNDGLGACFHAADQAGKRKRPPNDKLTILDPLNLGNVCTGNKILAGAGKNQSLDIVVLISRC